MQALPRHRPLHSHVGHHVPEAATAPPPPRSGLLMTLLLWVAAAVLLFEEWFWASSTRALETLARILHLSPLGAWIRHRPPAQALSLFILPVLAIYPFKVLALVALAHGDIVLGGAAFVGAKLAAALANLDVYVLELDTLAQTTQPIERVRQLADVVKQSLPLQSHPCALRPTARGSGMATLGAPSWWRGRVVRPIVLHAQPLGSIRITGLALPAATGFSMPLTMLAQTSSPGARCAGRFVLPPV